MYSSELLNKIGTVLSSLERSINDQASRVVDVITLENKSNSSIISKIATDKNITIAETIDISSEIENVKGHLEDKLESCFFFIAEEEISRIERALEDNIGSLDGLKDAINDNTISLEVLENQIMDGIINDVALYDERIRGIDNPEELGTIFGNIITENIEATLGAQVKSLDETANEQKSSLGKIFDVLKDSSDYLLNIMTMDMMSLDLTKEQLAREKEAKIFGDELDEKEKVPSPSNSSENDGQDINFENTFVGGLIGGIRALATNVLAGGAAFMAASLGMRGWELPIIQRITTAVANITRYMTDGISQIITPMIRFLDPVRDAAAGTGRLGKLIRSLLRPVIAAGNGIARFISSNGRTLFNNPLFRTAGAFAGTIGRILRPIGFLFSAFEGVQAFMGKEGTFYEKLIAGLSAAIGDFFGAPLDLLRDLTAWALEKFGFTNIAASLREFSFENIITDFLQSIFDWIGQLFSNPVQTLTNLFNTALGGFESVARMIFYPIDMAVQWISRAFGWEAGEDFSLVDAIMTPVNSAIAWIRGLFSDPTSALSSALTSILGGYESIARMIFYPIDMAVQWISRVFGWEAGEDFSLVDTIMGAVNSAITWIRGLFSDPVGNLTALWDGLLDGASNLAALLFAPVRSAFDWIAGRFDWETISQSFEEISILDMINEFLGRMREWVANLLPPLPSAQEIGEAFYNSLPPWLQTVVRRVAGFEDVEDIANRSLIAAAERLEAATHADEALAREILQAAERNRREEDSHSERIAENEAEQLRIQEILDAAARGEDIFRRGEMGGEFAWWGKAEEGIAAAQARLAELQLQREAETTANLERTADFIAEQQSRLTHQEIISAEKEQARQELDRLGTTSPDQIAAETMIREIQVQQAQRAALVSEREALLTDDVDNSQQAGRLEEIENILNEMPSSEILSNQLAKWMSRLDSFSIGSPGFVDFGQGTPAMLHGQEAVVPRTTPAGEFLANLFDSNWQPRFEMSTVPVVEPRSATESPLGQKTTLLANESTEMIRRGSPVIVRGGDNINKGGDVYRGGDTNTVINNLIEPSRKLNHIPA